MVVVQFLVGHRPDPLRRILARQRHRPLEHVDELLVALAWDVLHHEVPRQADADDVHVEAFRELHVEDRERDRQTLAVVDHAAEMAVGTVVVVGATAMEAIVGK